MKSQRSLHSSQTLNDRIHLPKINDTRSSYNGDEFYENPFYVPADEEIFKLKNKEKETKEMEKQRLQGLKIWEKGIKHASEGKLRKIRELIDFDEKEMEDDDGKLGILEAAKSAIKNRIRHKEPLINFLNKKREMFLFQMSINEKKEQIKEFEELAHLQEISLQNAKSLLEKDAEIFKQYVEKNKNETRQAIKSAEDETKEKQRKIQEMKQIQEELSTIMSKNTKQLEKLEKLYCYKVFLDGLTPDDFLKEQKKRKEERKRARSLPTSAEGQKKKQGKDEYRWQMYNIPLSKGILDLLEESDDEGEMYFKKPSQLEELFETLEEKNLFIIKCNQDIEQSLEVVKHNLQVKQTELLEKERQLLKNKQDLEKAIQQRTKSINELHIKTDKFTEKTLNKLENAIKHIYDTNKIFKDGKSDQQVSGFEVLKQIERKLEVQLKELKQFGPQKVLEQYRISSNKRREEINEQKKKEIAEEQKQKLEIIKKRLMAQKRFGRPIMAKSMLKQEDKKETEVNLVDPEEVERKLYFTVRFQ